MTAEYAGNIYLNRDQVRSKFTEVAGYRTHYLEAGSDSAFPLVLIHGGNFHLGLAAERWFPTIVPLSRDFHVFAPDEIGSGFSDPPRIITDIGDVRMRADHVLAFVEALGLGPVHLVGQSQGAWIAAYIAIKRPDLVRNLVLVDSASLTLPEGGLNHANVAQRHTDTFLPNTMYCDGLKPDAESVRRYLSSMLYDVMQLPDGFMKYAIDRARHWLPIWDKPWRTFWEDGGRRNREQYLVDGVHLRDHLHKLKTAPLIIWGKDTVKGLQSGIELFKSLPDSELHVFDKANHFLWIDQPERFNRSVSSFLVSRTG